MKINDTLKEIQQVSQLVIQKGLSVEEKCPIIKKSCVTWTQQKDLAYLLKNLSYVEKYKILNNDKNYNLRMLDGALIQMLYKFNNSGRKLLSHRLAYYPSPNLERYELSPESYENLYFGESEFHDLREQNIVTFPIRFDFNDSNDIFKDIEHPYSHVTFGEYENCRIPVSTPLTPSVFMEFIIRNFYFTAFKSKFSDYKYSVSRFPKSITSNEEKVLHFNIL